MTGLFYFPSFRVSFVGSLFYILYITSTHIRTKLRKSQIGDPTSFSLGFRRCGFQTMARGFGETTEDGNRTTETTVITMFTIFRDEV